MVRYQVKLIVLEGKGTQRAITAAVILTSYKQRLRNDLWALFLMEQEPLRKAGPSSLQWH